MAAITRPVYAGRLALHAQGARLARHRPMNEPMPFMSSCPTCGHWCLQDGYVRRALLRLLNTRDRIDAYCLACDGFWAISAEERHALGLWLKE